jgi:hypothetical protein
MPERLLETHHLQINKKLLEGQDLAQSYLMSRTAAVAMALMAAAIRVGNASAQEEENPTGTT